MQFFQSDNMRDVIVRQSIHCEFVDQELVLQTNAGTLSTVTMNLDLS
jgi:hypothetical protein